jgi:pyruvate,orthophosphate dikinase
MSAPACSLTTTPPPIEKVLLFSEGFAAWSDDAEARRTHLGGKGAGLAEMSAAGVRVPPGFTILADVCRDFYAQGERLDRGIMRAVEAKLGVLESELGRRFGDPVAPLLVSVRSGSKFSMPGMMDTVLNLGLNDATVAGLVQSTGDPRFAWDCYRRFTQMYGHVVAGLDTALFAAPLAEMVAAQGVGRETELDVAALRALVSEFKHIVLSHSQKAIPDDPKEQLSAAIEAVLRSWNNQRAIFYRSLHGIDHTLGTAVTVQAMVFGNSGEHSATGVCFTRNPNTGARELYGEYLTNAQGEDVVAGTRTPRPIADLTREMPTVARELTATAAHLEAHYRDVQDIEFTIEHETLYVLQTRTGKRTAAAAVAIAVDMVERGLISPETAVLRVAPEQIQRLYLPCFDEVARGRAVSAGRRLATGLNASPGAAIGGLVFTPDEAARLAATGHSVILARPETCPDDIHGIAAAAGVITSRGGMTSHAAVVARGMGKPCVAGCESLSIDPTAGTMRVNGVTLRQGDTVSIDGGSGEIYRGEIPTIAPRIGPEVATLLGWADLHRRLRVRANADTPLDAVRARELGAEGIGLCRTEHMFMAPDRLPIVRAMILASDRPHREAALAQLLPLQRDDFRAIFRAMEGLPVTIRLLDPPLHEFLPREDDLLATIDHARRSSPHDVPELEQTLSRRRELAETNPMMGFRGCRLGLVHPEIYAMQIRAIFEAAGTLTREGIAVFPEIMVPLVCDVVELRLVKHRLETVAAETLSRLGVEVAYTFGTMIEVPRACLTADAIAGPADFFSFGTNDLTQMTFAFSRDDAEGTFLPRYLEGLSPNGTTTPILPHNPFEVLDEAGVGALMRLAIDQGRRAKPTLKLGVCGEHGGEARSIELCERLGLDYVSCSPFRLPVARLAAAHATLGTTRRDV